MNGRAAMPAPHSRAMERQAQTWEGIPLYACMHGSNRAHACKHLMNFIIPGGPQTNISESGEGAGKCAASIS
jgi:hypothetical protein